MEATRMKAIGLSAVLSYVCPTSSPEPKSLSSKSSLESGVLSGRLADLGVLYKQVSAA
jgi:hypothetical protein